MTPFRFEHHLVLPGPPLVAWYAITTAQGLAGWTMPMPPQQGGPGVEVWDVNKRLSLRYPIGVDGAYQALDYVIEDRGDDSVDFTFTHSGELPWSPEEQEMTERAWDQYMFTLERFLTDHLERVPAYVEAQGPATKVGPKSWSTLLQRLGLDQPSVGDEVTIERDGFTTVRGTVDFVSDRFVGIAAEDRLIRFHGRWAIGQPLAVADHHYLPLEAATLDVHAERAAWDAWLTEL